MRTPVEEYESYFRSEVSSDKLQNGLRIALVGFANQLDPKLRVTVFAGRIQSCVKLGKVLMVAVVPADPLPDQIEAASRQVIGKVLGRKVSSLESDFLSVVLGVLASYCAGGFPLVGYFMNYLHLVENSIVADMPARERGRAVFLLAMSEAGPTQPDLDHLLTWIRGQAGRWAEERTTSDGIRTFLDDPELIRSVKGLCETLSAEWIPSPR